MATLIKRNTTIPTKQTQTFQTKSCDGSDSAVLVLFPQILSLSKEQKKSSTVASTSQSDIVIKVYEGERTVARDNYLLGTFELFGIPTDAAQIEVTFDIDANSLLTVSAREATSGNEATTKIANEKGHLCKYELERMIADAENDTKEDEIRRTSLI